MRGSGRALLLALLLAAMLSASLPAEAGALKRSFFGVVESSTSISGGLPARDAKLMRRGHVGTVRFVMWHSVVQANGWSTYDRIIGRLARKRIRPLPDLENNAGDYTPPISGAARTSWKHFVHQAVARYGRGGSFWRTHHRVPKRPVGSWQVGNEPSLPKYWPTKSPVRDYATFLKITHRAIHRVNHHATTVLAGLPGIVVDPRSRGWRFLNKLYRIRGVRHNFNVAAFQPYAPHVSDLGSQMHKFRRVMRHHGDKHKRVWITEFGYGSARYNHHLNFGRRGQARMLRRTFKVFAHRRRHWNIRGVVWYDWRDPVNPNKDCSFCSSAGLLRSGFAAKPSYHAFKRFAKRH